MATSVDPRAIVSPKAEIGDGVTIGPNTIVEDDVVIGSGTILGANILIANGTRVRPRVQDFSWRRPRDHSSKI